MNGDFAAIYLTLLNILFRGVFSFITYFFGFLSAEVNFHICTGKHPQFNIDKIFQYQTWSTLNSTGIIKTFEEANIADPVVYLIRLALILLSLTTIAIWAYAKRPSFNKQSLVCLKSTHIAAFERSLPQNGLERNNKYEENKTVLFGNGIALFTVICTFLMLSPHAAVKDLMKKEPEKLNHGIGKFMVYLSRITMLLVSYSLLPVVIFLTNGQMRNCIIRELWNIFHVSN
jgi:hypothetical protein